MPRITAKQIIKRVSCPHLDLYKGEGYWYFVYSDVENNRYESQMVYCMYLSQMSLESWISEGRTFVAQTEKKS